MKIDKKALKILIGTYWESTGWKSRYFVGPEDFEYAKMHGLMFDPIHVTHDKLIKDLIAIKNATCIQTVSNAFLASLSTRRLDLRSAIGSYGFSSEFPFHGISDIEERIGNGSSQCACCGHYQSWPLKQKDINVLNFERHMWGGVRHDQPLYAFFDLQQFKLLDPSEPAKEDREILLRILDIADNLPPNARPNALEKKLTGVFASNKTERTTLIELLSYCGILKPSSHSGYFREFTEYDRREHTNDHTNDWGYPARWWRGSDGVNPTALSAYFPNL